MPKLSEPETASIFAEMDALSTALQAGRPRAVEVGAVDVSLGPAEDDVGRLIPPPLRASPVLLELAPTAMEAAVEVSVMVDFSVAQMDAAAEAVAEPVLVDIRPHVVVDGVCGQGEADGNAGRSAAGGQVRRDGDRLGVGSDRRGVAGGDTDVALPGQDARPAVDAGVDGEVDLVVRRDTAALTPTAVLLVDAATATEVASTVAVIVAVELLRQADPLVGRKR